MVRKHALRVFTVSGEVLQQHLEYQEPGGKKGSTLRGVAYDAFTARWKDIENRVADEVSDAKAMEDLPLERDTWFPEGTNPQ